jgi:hypothetical protein
MLNFAAAYAYNVHSQNGEDGIIQEVWKRITAAQRDGYRYNGEGAALGHAVEIGGNDGRWLSNTCLLLEQGWSGLFVERDYELHLKSKTNWAHRPDVRHQCATVDWQNINAFVDERCDLISLDTDGIDHQLFHGLLVKPKIAIVEIDSSIPPDQLGFNADGAAGYLEMLRLAQLRDYFLLCHVGNMIFLRNEFASLFPEIDCHPELDFEEYFNRSWLPV